MLVPVVRNANTLGIAVPPTGDSRQPQIEGGRCLVRAHPRYRQSHRFPGGSQGVAGQCAASPAARQIGQIGQIDFAGPHWLANIPCGCITGPRQVNP